MDVMKVTKKHADQMQRTKSEKKEAQRNPREGYEERHLSLTPSATMRKIQQVSSKSHV